jgi:hypothetical protein
MAGVVKNRIFFFFLGVEKRKFHIKNNFHFDHFIKDSFILVGHLPNAVSTERP